MSADLHAALTALADEWLEGGLPKNPIPAIRRVLAAHPATDADLIAEAEDRGYEKGLLAPGSSWMKTRAEDIAQAKRDGAAKVVEVAVRFVTAELADMAARPPHVLSDTAQRVWMGGVDAAGIMAVRALRAAVRATEGD